MTMILTGTDARQMRERYAAGATTETLAQSFGVADRTVRSVLTGETWGSVGGPRADLSSAAAPATAPVADNHRVSRVAGVWRCTMGCGGEWSGLVPKDAGPCVTRRWS